MPIIEKSTYRAPKFFDNGHVQTIYPFFFRKVKQDFHLKERINTTDGDFLDLCWNSVHSDKLVILTHGLEGSTDSAYIKGMSALYNNHGFDSLSWNMRSCSGELNLKREFYHALSINDLEDVINYALSKGRYKQVHLVGFSLGASLTANYLGLTSNLPSEITSGIIFSCPVDLKATAIELSKPSKRFYLETFMITMRKKILAKAKVEQFETKGIWAIKTFEDFDNRFTAPLHGFLSAQDYYQKASCIHHLPNIKVPFLIVNAKDDPFLTKECFPYELAKQNKYIHLEAPKTGGHVGFVCFNDKKFYWSEKRALQFSLDAAGIKIPAIA